MTARTIRLATLRLQEVRATTVLSAHPKPYDRTSGADSGFWRGELGGEELPWSRGEATGETSGGEATSGAAYKRIHICQRTGRLIRVNVNASMRTQHMLDDRMVHPHERAYVHVSERSTVSPPHVNVSTRIRVKRLMVHPRQRADAHTRQKERWGPPCKRVNAHTCRKTGRASGHTYRKTLEEASKNNHARDYFPDSWTARVLCLISRLSRCSNIRREE